MGLGLGEDGGESGIQEGAWHDWSSQWVHRWGRVDGIGGASRSMGELVGREGGRYLSRCGDQIVRFGGVRGRKKHSPRLG